MTPEQEVALNGPVVRTIRVGHQGRLTANIHENGKASLASEDTRDSK